tara:strand:- start:68 stop:802 length:735 start_codon:yes stop_codon:yes gene_type:complete
MRGVESDVEITAPDRPDLPAESAFSHRKTKQSVFILLGMVILFLGLTALKCLALSSVVYALSPDGRLMGALLATKTLMWLLVAISVIPIFTFSFYSGLLAIRAMRYKHALVHTSCAFAFLALVFNFSSVHLWATRPFERASLARVPIQGQLLINALEAYHGQRGAYPEVLDALVPEFIEAIPPTGLSSKSRFRYVMDNESPFYRLTASRDMGFFDFNYLYYSPDPDFSGTGNMGAIGAWAYIDG